MENQRNEFIDIIKGVTIFLMLWGHCIQYCVANSEIDFFENYVFKTIYSFHMPLFMLVSGYLFFYSAKKRSFKKLLAHKIQALLQPIIVCSVFNFLVTTLLFNIISGNYDEIFKINLMQVFSSLWFLWSVLASSLITAFVYKKCKNPLVQIFLFFVCIPIVALFPNISQNLFMYPYFILGFYFAKYRDRLSKRIHNMKYLSLIFFPLLLCFYEKKHFIYTTGLLPNNAYSLGQMLMIDSYRWLIGLVGSIFTTTVLQILYKPTTAYSNRYMINTYLSQLGKKSLQIYALSVPFLSIYLTKFFPKILSFFNINNIFVKNMLIYNFVFTLTLAIIYAIVLYFIVKCFEKLKIAKIIFGK